MLRPRGEIHTIQFSIKLVSFLRSEDSIYLRNLPFYGAPSIVYAESIVE